MDKLLRVGKQVTFCPSHWGGKDWPPAAYNPKTRLLYIPLQQNLCTTLVGEAKIAPYAAGKRYVGTDAAKTRVFAREGADHIGEVQAWDLDTGKLVWTYNFPDMGINWGPLLTTGGGLIFGGGSADRKFRALDATSGKLLWEFKTNSGITGVPSSYMVDGVQVHRRAIGLGRGRTKDGGPSQHFDEDERAGAAGRRRVGVRGEGLSHKRSHRYSIFNPIAAISLAKRSRSVLM